MSDQKPPEPVIAADAPPAALEHAVTTAPVPTSIRIEKPTKAETIHIKRAWNGRMSVEEAWADGLDWNARCCGCNAPRKQLVGWIRIYLPLPDFHRAFGVFGAMVHAQKHGGKLPIVELVAGPFVWLGSNTYFCKMCQGAAEKAAAQSPSYAWVEIRRPPKNKIQVAVPRG